LEVKDALVQTLQIAKANALEEEDFVKAIQQKIAWLLQYDFNALLNMLYTLDVDEAKLQKAIEQNTNKELNEIISDVIIERQLKRIADKVSFSLLFTTASEEEKW